MKTSNCLVTAELQKKCHILTIFPRREIDPHMYSRGFKAQVLGGMTALIARTTATPLSKQPVQQSHMTAIKTITIPALGGGVVEFGGLPHERARSQPQTGLRLLLSHSDWVTPDSRCHAYYQTHQDTVYYYWEC